MNQPSNEHTRTCAEELAGGDTKKAMLLEIMDHCGLGYFMNSAIRKVALHEANSEQVCDLWSRTQEDEKAFFIINAPHPNPFYDLQRSYIDCLKGRYSGNIDAMAKSEQTNQERLDADLKKVPVEDMGTLDGQAKAVADVEGHCPCASLKSHADLMTGKKELNLKAQNPQYRPVVESADGKCSHTLPTLREFLRGTGEDIKQIRDTVLTYKKFYKQDSRDIDLELDTIVAHLDQALESERELYNQNRDLWDPFVSRSYTDPYEGDMNEACCPSC